MLWAEELAEPSTDTLPSEINYPSGAGGQPISLWRKRHGEVILFVDSDHGLVSRLSLEPWRDSPEETILRIYGAGSVIPRWLRPVRPRFPNENAILRVEGTFQKVNRREVCDLVNATQEKGLVVFDDLAEGLRELKRRGLT